LLPGFPRRPLPTKKTARAGVPPTRENRFQGDLQRYDLVAHASQVAKRSATARRAPANTALRPATTEVMVGGLGPRTMAMADKMLEPMGMHLMQTGGGGQSKTLLASAPKTYQDGGVITVQLVRGDISMSGLGTVTHVVGDKLVAFGHPMINGGIEALPTAIGHVHWILSTQNRSFKIGEPTRSLGTLVNDRQASIVIDTKITAPTFPVSLAVSGALGAPKTAWDVEISHDPFFAPSFVAVSLGSALETTTGERNDLTWRAKSKIAVEGHGTIEFDDFGAGNQVPLGAGTISRTRLVRAVGSLMNNPWQSAQLKGIEMELAVTHKREVMLMMGSKVLDPEVDPGQSARVELQLQPWGKNERRTQVIEVPIERSLAGQTVKIQLQPGYAVERLVAPPKNFGELVRSLPDRNFPSQTVVASYKLPDEASTAYEGHVAHRLPPYAADLLRPASQSDAPILYGATKQVAIPVPRFLVGKDTVTIKVRDHR
ncbi:MAG: hypothetical protein AAGA56_29950, partial [Myxococcota bacterium]